ncbi:uncharacterized protein LTR77_006925 [Saxophila tyrrhenica]|uniref:Peptidase A1 domain-containing protein n=1 Tax=Saxophila tyrrhenica TaxID=1690608 RepID=A0AAV9P956_9PEZI|nr:hypothetical protein LTR77_006925 [Saxophila tyrrhenica]
MYDDVRLGLLNGDILLDTYTLGLPTHDFGSKAYPQNSFGIGARSKLLNTLQSVGHIASSSYSYFNGHANVADPSRSVDGRVVLGGYDAALNGGGPHISNPMVAPTPRCPIGMWVDVEDLLLTFANGTMPSLSQQQLLRACVSVSEQYIMSVPIGPYCDRFADYVGTGWRGYSGSVINDLGTLYDADMVYRGGLHIRLSPNVTIELTHSMLVTFEQDVGPSGAIDTDFLTAEVLIFPFADASMSPVIGRQCFSAAQLFVDYEANTFISPAVQNAASDLVAVGKDCAVKNSGSSVGGGTGLEYNATSEKYSSQAGLSGGTIAGIAIGAMAILALIAAAVFFTMKRRRRRSDLAKAMSSSVESYESMSELSPTAEAPAEVPADSPRRELESEGVMRHELDAPRQRVELG